MITCNDTASEERQKHEPRSARQRCMSSLHVIVIPAVASEDHSLQCTTARVLAELLFLATKCQCRDSLHKVVWTHEIDHGQQSGMCNRTKRALKLGEGIKVLRGAGQDKAPVCFNTQGAASEGHAWGPSIIELGKERRLVGGLGELT